MPRPSSPRTVQARILAYAQEIGWTFVSREEAEQRRAGFPTRQLPRNGGQECPPSVDAGWKTRAPFEFNDKDVDTLIGHFRDPERRKEFFKEYKEIEMLYEIISPDAFLRPFLDDYTTLSSIYLVVRNAYARRVYVDRDFQKKPDELVQKHIGAAVSEPAAEYVVIDRSTIETIKRKEEGKATKVINLVKAIEKEAEEKSDDPFLLAMADRARAVQESFEARQNSTEQALDDLLAAIATNEARRKEQAAKGLDKRTHRPPISRLHRPSDPRVSRPAQRIPHGTARDREPDQRDASGRTMH